MINPAQSRADLFKGADQALFGGMVSFGRMLKTLKFPRVEARDINFIEHGYLQIGCCDDSSLGDAGFGVIRPRTVSWGL